MKSLPYFVAVVLALGTAACGPSEDPEAKAKEFASQACACELPSDMAKLPAYKECIEKVDTEFKAWGESNLSNQEAADKYQATYLKEFTQCQMGKADAETAE